MLCAVYIYFLGIIFGLLWFERTENEAEKEEGGGGGGHSKGLLAYTVPTFCIFLQVETCKTCPSMSLYLFYQQTLHVDIQNL